MEQRYCSQSLAERVNRCPKFREEDIKNNQRTHCYRYQDQGVFYAGVLFASRLIGVRAFFSPSAGFGSLSFFGPLAFFNLWNWQQLTLSSAQHILLLLTYIFSRKTRKTTASDSLNVIIKA